LLFLGHNFRTTNARKPFKGSKGADFRLVFLKKRSKNCFLGWGPRARWRHLKHETNLSQLCRHLQKDSNPKLPNYFFNRNYKTFRIVRRFVQLSSSIRWRVMTEYGGTDLNQEFSTFSGMWSN